MNAIPLLPQSVDSAIKGLSNAVNNLRKVSTRENNKADKKLEKADKLATEATKHREEAGRADLISANISKLLGEELVTDSQ